MKSKIISFGYLLFCALLTGCGWDLSLDDKYSYVYHYRVTNQLESAVSGYLIRSPVYYRDSLFFQVDKHETIELFNNDGGNGPKVTPRGTGIWTLKRLRLNINDTVLNINVEKEDTWTYRTEESTGIYTFFITKDLL